jgi:hypothetical protein
MKKLKLTLFVSLILLGAILEGCTETATPTSAVSTDPALQTTVTALAENLMSALRNDDYQAFTENYDQTMLNETTQDSFQLLRSQLESKMGAYQTLTPRQVQTGDGYINAFFDVGFEKGSLIMQLVITETEPHQIHGFGFK